ncbi:MAG: hypothetical protein ACOYMN_15210 [Roseimicrobium sp.]
MDLLEEHAREKAGMGEDWKGYHFQCLPEHPAKTELVTVTGAVAPKKLRGKRKGETNWDKMDRATKRTVYITLADHDAWVKAWESKTGLCSTCKGTKQEWAGWSAKEGTRYRPCKKCGESGLANKEITD